MTTGRGQGRIRPRRIRREPYLEPKFCSVLGAGSGAQHRTDAWPEAPLRTLTLGTHGTRCAQLSSSPSIPHRRSGPRNSRRRDIQVPALRALPEPLAQSPGGRSRSLDHPGACSVRAGEARLRIYTTFWLGASEPGTNTRRVVSIAQLFASLSERLLCTTTLTNAWYVLFCLVRSPWGRSDVPRFKGKSAKVQRHVTYSGSQCCRASRKIGTQIPLPLLGFFLLTFSSGRVGSDLEPFSGFDFIQFTDHSRKHKRSGHSFIPSFHSC